MLSALKPTIYVQISPERLTVRNVRNGESISEVPEIAIGHDPKPTILAVGEQARIASVGTTAKVFNPFSHPRSLVSDFTLGEQVLKAFLRKIQSKSLLAFGPLVVLHPLGEPAGGLTQVEIRAFHEMAIGAGASQVIVWHGSKLSDEQILTNKFPQSGEVLS